MNDSRQDQNHDKKDDPRLYDRLLARAEVLLEGGRNNLEDALRKASEELTSFGEYSREQADRVSAYIKRDVLHANDKKENPAAGLNEQAQSEAGDSTTSFSQTVRDAIDPKRVATGAQSFFSKVMISTATTLGEWGRKMEGHLEFRTGDVTSPGTLTCKNCGESIRVKQTTQIPSCPKCGHVSFRKSY